MIFNSDGTPLKIAPRRAVLIDERHNEIYYLEDGREVFPQNYEEEEDDGRENLGAY